MPDYDTFTPDDFVGDPFFQNWVRHPTAENETFWQEWLARHPDRADDVKLARQLVMSLPLEQLPVSQQQIEQDVQRMLQRIQQQEKRSITRVLTPTFSLRYWAAAAVVVLTLGLGWWLYENRQAHENVPLIAAQQPRGMLQKRNETPHSVQLKLPDGSEVTLSPGSMLTYPVAFADSSREVTLTGEAFFNVVRKPTHPFLVYADQIVTRVLGTSFRVRAYPQDGRLTVVVRTGKVAVYAHPDYVGANPKTVDKRTISLTANQQADFSKTNAVFRKTLVEKPTLIDQTIKASDFEFDETPVSDVLQRFEQAYGINIIYDSDVLRDCALTASLTNETMTEKMMIICKGIGATYEIIDGTIVIHSKGCR